MTNEEIKKKLQACYMDIRELLYVCSADDYEMHEELSKNLESLRDSIQYVTNEMLDDDSIENRLRKYINNNDIVGDDEC